MAVRATQVHVDTLLEPDPAVRSTQVHVDVLATTVLGVRVTQAHLDVLQSSAEVPDVTVVYHAGGALAAAGATPVYYAS